MSTSDTRLRRRDPTLSALSEKRRRILLSLVADRSDGLPESALAIQLAVRETDRSLDALTDDEIDRVSRLLHHQDLPLLESASLVDWDRGEQVVRRTDHVVYGDPAFRAVIDDGEDHWDDILRNLADTRRQRLLRILHDTEDRIEVDTVVTKLLAAEVSSGDGTVSTDRFDKLRIELHHCHLPKLDGCGLLDWDHEADTVVYVGHPEFDSVWLTPRVIGTADRDTDTARLSDRNEAIK